ncbi:MAG TPA: IS110 family transposase [Solirubrobacteraceae bacterium]|nr:IS110 family transposase [Solirubrobacteraceae bacterium]
MDLSRKRLDFCLLDEQGDHVEVGAAPPDGDGLAGLVRRVAQRHGQPVSAAIESMNGARFVHDTLERCGWEVEVADAQKVKGLAPLACKTDRIDAWVLAELSRRDLVPAIWLPSFEQRQERERARWRLFLVRKRSSLKHRVHAQLLAFGHTCPVSDLFGRRGRELLGRLEFPQPWRSGVLASVTMIDDLDRQITDIDRELKTLGADHRYIPLLMTAPGIAWVLGYTIAAEIGDIDRFASPKKLCGYTGLCPKVYQSGGTDRRGHLTHAGPKYLRWALIEAAQHAARHPLYRERYQRTKARLGKQRGPKVAQVDIARRLAEAIWHMLTRNQPFAPPGATPALAA